MMNKIGKKGQGKDIRELMKVVQNGHLMGINFHIHKRNRLPSCFELGVVSEEGWLEFKQSLKTNYDWDADDELNFTHRNGFPTSRSMSYIHFDEGATVFKNLDGWIKLAYDHDCDPGFVEELNNQIQSVCKKSTIHEIGFLQMSGVTLYVKDSKFKPHEKDIIPYLGEELIQFRNQILNHINDENGNGLYLLHGQPGTGKTSFIKSLLAQTKRKAIYISTSMTDKLTSPDIIGLLMDYPDSILIIEDAETNLMKRAGDNSSAVSNLLNMSDGFPADFLNLCIFCTFNTELDNIDPALLRRGRLKGMMEFKPLQPEQAETLAGVLEVNRELNGPVTIAELCNEEGVGLQYQKKSVGFQGVN